MEKSKIVLLGYMGSGKSAVAKHIALERNLIAIDLDSYIEQKEALQKIFSAINQLPENQKTVVILLKIEHNSVKEVAEILRLSPKAVESLFQRAKTKLSFLLNQQNENE